MADQSFDRSAIGFLYTVRIGFELIWAEKMLCYCTKEVPNGRYC